jgi:hypothetical protein
MAHWEYCIVHVVLYRDGSEPAGEPRELLSITRPGAQRAPASHPLGSIGLLNQLGAEGWELVQVASSGMYLKRQVAGEG